MHRERELVKILNGMADFIHDGSKSFCDYKIERKIYQDIIDSMNRYMIRNNINASQMIKNSNYKATTFLKDPYYDHQIQNDLILYDHVDYILSMVDFYQKTKKYKTLEYMNMLDCMKESRLGIYRIIERNEKDATVTLDNVITHQPILITDRYLGTGKQKYNDRYLLLRIIEANRSIFQTGLLLSFPNDLSTRNWLKKTGYLFLEKSQLNALLEAYHFYCIQN